MKNVSLPCVPCPSRLRMLHDLDHNGPNIAQDIDRLGEATIVPTRIRPVVALRYCVPKDGAFVGEKGSILS